MTKYNKPRITISKKDCQCDETGNNIKKFESVLVVKEGGKIKVFCKDSIEYHNHTHVNKLEKDVR